MSINNTLLYDDDDIVELEGGWSVGVDWHVLTHPDTLLVQLLVGGAGGRGHI